MKDWKKKSTLFLVSQNISLFGSSIVSYAITWYITLETSSGVWMTASILCSLLPQLLISLFAGVWADRYNRKYLIMCRRHGNLCHGISKSPKARVGRSPIHVARLERRHCLHDRPSCRLPNSRILRNRLLPHHAGGVYVSWKGSFKNKWLVIAVSYIGFGITFALLGVSPYFWMYLAIMFLSGTFMPSLATASTVMLQEQVEEQRLGRVFSVFQIISAAMMPAGMLIFGPMADWVDIRWIMTGSGLLLALTGIFLLKRKI